MKIVYRLLADSIWALHLLVVLTVLFGWLFPEWWHWYVSVLVAVLVSNVLWNYCLLSKWEFNLRKMIDPKVQYDHTYTSYYTYNLTRSYLSKYFLRWAGLGFTSLSLVISVYFRYFF
jgi:hypothetical protein